MPRSTTRPSTEGRSLPTLILVHRKPLLDQWRVQLINLLGLNHLALELLIRETPFAFQGKEETSIQEVFRAVVHDESRTAAICDDILEALASGRRCLVLSERKEHCRALANRLADRGRMPFLLDGGLRKPARDAVLSAIRSAAWKGSEEPYLLIIATGQYLGEGFDCPQIDTLFLAFPVSFKGKLTQYVGRVMRVSEGRDRVRVYDYADVRVPVLKRMHAKRLKTFEALGFAQMDDSRRSKRGLWGSADIQCHAIQLGWGSSG